MDSSKLKTINEKLASDQSNKTRESVLLGTIGQVGDNVLLSAISLIKYLEGTTSKVELTNQLQSIGTPDALKVVKSVDDLHRTLKTHKNTDLTAITSVMESVLKEAQNIPKVLPELKIPDPIDNTKHFEDLTKAIQAVEKVVKAQKLIAEAPVVNVPEGKAPVVNMDLKPLEKEIKDNAKTIVTSIKKIAIPDYGKHNTEVEKQLKQSNKILQSILEKPVGGAGGGGGSSWPAVGIDDLPKPLKVDASGNLLTTNAGSGVQNTFETTGLVPKVYDYLSLSYTAANLTGVVYKAGGSSGTTVATLTIAYSGSNITSVTRT